ncbi:Flp family type IVb pilin [Acidiphilium sp. PM]|uniref:Flp family type IVb pilin n=1 Tax=Acidiphilium sp. PM TaxID=1043206 RepID=UPI00031A6049|nr:Flp family type IVb pilin [Acidiphilium sp. PM]
MLQKTVNAFIADESGVTAIEYGLIAALIAVVIIAAVTLVGKDLSNIFNTVATSLSNAN